MSAEELNDIFEGLYKQAKHENKTVFQLLKEMLEDRKDKMYELEKIAVCPNKECNSPIEERNRSSDSEPNMWYYCEYCREWIYCNDVRWITRKEYEAQA